MSTISTSGATASNALALLRYNAAKDSLKSSAMATALVAPSPQSVVNSFGKGDEKAANALTTLKQTQSDSINARKSAALQRLNRVREMLKVLRKFSGLIKDPKAILRQAKFLAEELRAAAKDYALALKLEGGGSGGGSSAAPVAIPSVDVAPAESASSSDSPTADSSTADSSPDASEADNANTQTAPAAGNDSVPEASQPSKPDSLDSQDSAAMSAVAGVDQDALRQKIIQTYRDGAEQIETQVKKNSSEQEVLEKFKDAALGIKSLLEDAIRKLKAKNPNDPDAKAGQKALDAMQKQVVELEKTMGSPSSSASDASGLPNEGFVTSVPNTGASTALRILA